MLTLITGGSKNGKSHIAEEIISHSERTKYYIATMEPYCEEAQAAISRHRAIRSGKGFITLEQYTDIESAPISDKSAVLLECACNLCANEMFTADCKNPVEKITDGICKLLEKAEVLIIVTNEVGSDAVSYVDGTVSYIENMGKLNRRLAEMADNVIEAVYGIPYVLKGELPL